MRSDSMQVPLLTPAHQGEGDAGGGGGGGFPGVGGAGALREGSFGGWGLSWGGGSRAAKVSATAMMQAVSQGSGTNTTF